MNLDPAFLTDLDEAQRIGLDACTAVFGSMQAGMTQDDVSRMLQEEVSKQGATLLESPWIAFGPETGGGYLSRIRGSRPLENGEVVTLDVRPIIGKAAGDVADTQVVGENGRHWQYQRMAYRIYHTFLHELPNCKTEQDVIRLADECAYQKGFQLYHPLSGSIAHPILPTDQFVDERRQLKMAFITNRLRRLIPGKQRLFEGPWSVEPRFLADDVGFMFESVVLREDDGTLKVMGGTLPQGVPIGPWLA